MADNNQNGNNGMKKAFQIGLTVLILLAAFTIGEYFIGSIAIGWTTPLWIIAFIKAFFIIRDYMHLPRLFVEGEEAQ